MELKFKMVGERTYVRLLRKFIGNCSGVKSLFLSDEKFEEVSDRMRLVQYRVHNKIYSEQKRKGEVYGLSRNILELEGRLFHEKVNRELMMMGN